MGDNRAFSLARFDRPENLWNRLQFLRSSRREGGISSGHELFPRDITFFGATAAEPAAILLPVFRSLPWPRHWIAPLRVFLRAQGEARGHRRAV